MPASRTILIAGPTASGKSALALALAERIGGTVINADSMQVYRELRVLTARPIAEDEARAPHSLYGHVPASDAYSAGRYARDVAQIIADTHAEGRVPVIAGGTGFYFKALLEGLSPIPETPVDVRLHWRNEAERLGPSGLYDVLAARDPEMAARLKPSDPQRIVRALEVLEATGRSLARWQDEPGTPIVRASDTHRLVVEVERETLLRRCDERFETMMSEGALDEVRALAAQGLSDDLPAMRALGVQPLMQLLRRELSQEEAVRAAQAETRQYVKRQRTWLKSNMITWKHISTQETQSIISEVMAFIRH